MFSVSSNVYVPCKCKHGTLVFQIILSCFKTIMYLSCILTIWSMVGKVECEAKSQGYWQSPI